MGSRNLLSPRHSLVLLVSLLATAFATDVQALLSEGPLNPAVAVDNGGLGSSWNPSAGNATTSNDVYAQTSPAGMASNYLKVTDFGFNIPAPAEIKGIEVLIERHTSTGVGTLIQDSSVKIVKGGVITGNEHADTGVDWPTTDAVKTYGSNSDLWMTTWTPADINSSGFGAALSVIDTGNTANVDVIQIKVYYDLCAAVPAGGCRTSLKSIFIVKDKGADSPKDKMIWKWIKGQSTQQTEFGNPTVPMGATNALCVYSNGALIAEALVGPSTTLWAPISTKGYKYKDKAGTQSGITKIIQKGSAPMVDKSKILVKGKGAGLPDIVPALTLPVDVQLVNSESGLCWGSTFVTMDVIKNESGFFKAKAQ